MEQVRQLPINPWYISYTRIWLDDPKDDYAQGGKDIRQFQHRALFHDQAKVQKGSPTMHVDLLLTFTMRLNAADPRDKVFALVRLVPEGDRLALAPDYSKSVA
jgi:hypothetical protein